MPRSTLVFMVPTLLLILGCLAMPCWADSTFLWKPVSDNTGKLVVLFPSQYRPEAVQKVTIKGSLSEATSSGEKYVVANGDRVHVRFSKPGKAFGTQVQVTLYLDDGSTHTWTVPDGSKRYTDTKGGSAGRGGSSSSSNAGSSSLKDILGIRNGKALVYLDAKTTGTKRITISADTILKARVCLRTYGAASLKITVNGDSWVSWSRSNSSDSSPCYEGGKEVKDSIYEETPGDPSAREVKFSRDVKAGDILEASLAGQEFGEEKTFLVVEGSATSTTAPPPATVAK